MEEQNQHQTTEPTRQPEKPKKRFYKYIGISFVLLGFLYFLIFPMSFVILDPSEDRYHCPSNITELSENLFTSPVSLVILIVFLIITLVVTVIRYIPKYKNNLDIIFIYRRINLIVFIVFVILYFIAMFTVTPMEFLPAEGWISPC